LEIKKLYDDNEFDVFLGSGWDNWIRVKIGKNKQVEVLDKSEHVTPTPKLLELVFYKTRRYG
jgi:hypothetical protein